jgi:hypothetical protein
VQSRKVRYSCFVVCLTVLLGSSSTPPAAAGEVANLRFAVGPNWGGPGNPTPVPLPSAKTEPVVMPVKVSEPWDVLWMDVWQKTNQIYRIDVADTVRQTPGCTGNLGLEVIVEQTVRAVRDRKYGDAVKYMAQFQDRSLCLNVEGVRGLDAALSRYTERAIRELPADQQRIAIHGTFNLGMLAYDQISDTGRSCWQGIVGFMYYPQMVAQMNTYPAQELGLWSFNYQNGLLVQSTSQQALLDKLATLANPSTIASTTTNGGSGPAQSAGSGNTGGGFKAGSAGTGADLVGCLVAASGSSGGRGMFTCMQKATVGIRPSVVDVLAGPFDPSVSVRDPQCARSEGGGGSSKDTGNKTTPPKKTDDRGVFVKFWDYLWGNPPPSQKTGKCAGIDGCTDIDPKAPKPPPGNYRTAQGDPGAEITVGGGCGNPSNAARRAQAVYDCYQGGGTAAAGGASPKPGGPGVIDPTIALTTEPQTSGTAAGMLACLSQGGSLVRLSVNDPRCLKAKCVQGEQCSCEGAVAGSQGQVVGGGVGLLDPWTSPYGGNCPDPPCGSAPGGGGTVAPPKPPPVPPPPVPATQRTIPVSPPTTLMPATQGTTSTIPQPQKGAIGTVSPLQQRGTTGSVPPLP